MVWYKDLSGAYFITKAQDLKEERMLGVEIAHARENGHNTIMICAFEGPLIITRPFGRGTAN